MFLKSVKILVPLLLLFIALAKSQPPSTSPTPAPTPRPCPTENCPRASRQGKCVKRGNDCRLVGNECLLRRLNCPLAANQRWTNVSMRNCRRMRVGGNPRRCSRRRWG